MGVLHSRQAFRFQQFRLDPICSPWTSIHRSRAQQFSNCRSVFATDAAWYAQTHCRIHADAAHHNLCLPSVYRRKGEEHKVKCTAKCFTVLKPPTRQHMVTMLLHPETNSTTASLGANFPPAPTHFCQFQVAQDPHRHKFESFLFYNQFKQTNDCGVKSSYSTWQMPQTIRAGENKKGTLGSIQNNIVYTITMGLGVNQ
jgi:hypothetical protein